MKKKLTHNYMEMELKIKKIDVIFVEVYGRLDFLDGAGFLTLDGG